MRKFPRILAILLAGSCLPFFAQAQKISGFSASASEKQKALEHQFDGFLDTAHVDQLIRDMSARPHNIGSPGDQAVAQYILHYYQSLGFEARIDTLYSLFPTPKERLLEMTGPVKYKALLAEPALPEDATSGQTKEQLPTYNCWSADGDITGELVFVNYGLPEDYETLRQMGVDVKGKIVIAKYGHSWRGIKPKVAQEHGAIGCLIYSDPADDGYDAGDVYPKGAYKNEYGVQRGSIMDMPIYPGDPQTPGYGHDKNARLIDRKDVTNLLRIPVLPLSYHDAAPLLKAMDGPVVPRNWQGGLPFTYHIGPGKSTVHLKLSFNWEVRPLYDVIALIRGAELPDEWVIRGNHHDAWVNGASDPISGLAAEMEEARGLAGLLKQGWKPRRTIVYCAWDGEEPGLLGSTEWAEYHGKELQQKAVVYINSDGNGRGFFGASGSHAFTPMINEIAHEVTDPQTKVSIFERSLSRRLVQAASAEAREKLLASKEIPLEALGAGSDYSPFFQHLGIPSLDLGFGGENNGGEYHSIYDSYDNYRRFKDPHFEYGVALAQTAGRVTLRMADAETLPFDYRSLFTAISEYSKEVMNLADQMRESTRINNELIRQNRYVQAADPSKTYFPPQPKDEVPYLDFSSLQNALVTLDQSTRKLADYLKNNKHTTREREALNQSMYHAEQQLLLDKGLPRRGWYRHAIYAPGFYTGYGVKTLPGIREAIEQRNWKEAQEQIKLAAGAIEKFSAYLAETVPATR